MGKQETEAAIRTVTDPVCSEHGLELIDVSVSRRGRRSVVEVIIDRPDGSVSSADCEWLSQRLSVELDALDPVPGAYYLEVSSPGVDRPLTTRRDFDRFAGQRVSVSLYGPLDGHKHLVGTLVGADDERFEVIIESGDRIQVPYERAAKVRLAPLLDDLLNRQPKSGQKKTGRR